MRSLRFMTTPQHKNVQDGNEPPSLDISLDGNGREKFGLISPISPISKDDPTTPSSQPKSLPSVRNKNDNPASLYRSTPDRSIDMTTDNAVNCSYMSNKRKSFHFNDERSSEFIDTVSFSCDDDMQLSYGSQQHQQHPQTPQMNRSKRRCNSVNRKNLSRSFNQIEEQQHQQLKQHSATTIIRTDSGFNEPTEYSSQHTTAQLYDEQNHQLEDEHFAFHNLTTKSCDVSMASIH